MIYHWNEFRAISSPEAKRLSSFPDDFIIEGDYKEQALITGNSVPPLMMRGIALHVKDLLKKQRNG